ncbi:MAG: hypothetical protein ABSF44_06925 [Candidatus Bathyarchaeia archaeon]|jgi:DNA-directed RNA polymerase subunit RPC12/RpoP
MIKTEDRGKALAPTGIFGNTEVRNGESVPGLGALPNESQSDRRPSCPDCNSRSMDLNGPRRLSTGEETQTFACNDCGKKFSENYIRVRIQNRTRQICALGAKNLGCGGNKDRYG